MATKLEFVTKCRKNGKYLATDDSALATMIDNAYSEFPEGDTDYRDDNMLGGKVTDEKKFFANLRDLAADAKLEFVNAAPPPAKKNDAPPPSTVVPSATSEKLPALCADWDLSKKMAGMLMLYGQRYLDFADGHTSVGKVQSVFELDHTNIGKVLKANKQLTVGKLTDAEKQVLQKVSLANMISAFSTVREVTSIFSPPGFLYWCLGYDDFTVYYLKDLGFVCYFGAEFVMFDHNYGFVNRSATFDHKLEGYGKRIDYWDAEFASQLYTFCKFIDVPSRMVENKIEVSFNLVLLNKQYTGVIYPDNFKEAMNHLFLPSSISPSVAVPNEWDSNSRETLVLAEYMKRFPPGARKTAVDQAESAFFKATKGMPISFAKTDAVLLGMPQKLTGKDADSLSISEFIDSYIMLDSVIAFSKRVFATWINGADNYDGYPVVSYGQWVRILEQGRALRGKSPGREIFKEYGVIYGFPQEIQGASTSRKGSRRLEILSEFYPDCYDADVLHYVGITSTDNMIGHVYNFWLDRWRNDVEAVKTSFFGYDINQLGSNVLNVGDKFQMVQDKNFFTKSMDNLLASEYVATKKYVLFSDAYIVHAKDSPHLPKNNPFKSGDAPSNWPRLINTTLKDGYVSASDEERSLYNFFSAVANKYVCGVVKFHLLEHVTPLFWEVLAARFRTMGKEYFLWKSGRIHNLEFDFYFGPLPGFEEKAEGVAVPPGAAPPSTESPAQEAAEGEETEETKEEATASSPPSPPTKSIIPGIDTSVKPRLADATADRFLDKRRLILVYFTQLATYCEVHRTFTWMNPLSTYLPEARDAVGRDLHTHIKKATKGYRDLSYHPSPDITTVTIGNEKIPAILADKIGTKRLEKGITSNLSATNSLLSVNKLREQEVDKLDFSSATREDNNVAPVPKIPLGPSPSEDLKGKPRRYNRRRGNSAAKDDKPSSS